MGRKAKFLDNYRPPLDTELRLDAPWRARALCLGETTPDYDPWHPASPGAKAEIEAAVGICNECPVRADCLTDALHIERGKSAFYRFGIWGGLMPEERAALGKANA